MMYNVRMPIKAAILGYGRSGSTLHADPLDKLKKDFTVTAVCDIDPEAMAKAKSRFNCALYKDYHEMLEKEELDLVVIVTRSDQHCQMTCDCLHAGANVLVTKPWCVNTLEAKKMIAAADESGQLLLPWLPARWGSDLARAKEIVASGAIGKIFMIRRCEFNFGIRNDWQTLKKHGGGYLLNWGPHIIDQAVQLAGEDVKSVYAQLRQTINPGDAEDVFYATLITESGIILACEFNTAVAKLPNWVIQGDRGTVFIKEKSIEIHKVKLPEHINSIDYRNSPEITLIKENLKGEQRISMGNRYGVSLEIYPEIAKAIRKEAIYPVSTASALKLSSVFDAVRASNDKNQIINI